MRERHLRSTPQGRASHTCDTSPRGPVNTTPTLPAFTFVGGVPRSGTSLVQKILDLHSEVYAGPEISVIPELMRTYRHLQSNIESGKVRMVLDVDHARAAYRDLVTAFFSDRIEQDHPRMISEKTPTNALAFEPLSEVFPRARFVWVVRDPRDVVCSFRAVQQRGRAASAPVALGRSLHNDIRLIRLYHRAGESFLEAHADRLHVIHYESLVARPHEEAERLCSFLGLQFQEGMLRTEQPNDTSTAIDAPRRTRGVFYDRAMFDRPIDSSGVGRWKKELGRSAARMVAAALATDNFRTFEPYDLDRVGRQWRLLLRAAAPIDRVRQVTRARRTARPLAPN